MKNILNLDEINEHLAEGILQLYKFDKQISDEYGDYPDTDISDICADILIERSWGDDDILKEGLNDLNNNVFEYLEYNIIEAEKIYDRLRNFLNQDEDETIAALRDFDKFSRDYSDDDIYPMVMMNSLSVISTMWSLTQSQTVHDAAEYVISNYDNFWLSEEFKDDAEELYDRVCEKLGFFATNRRFKLEAERLEDFLTNHKQK